jgi:uncharacterized protein
VWPLSEFMGPSLGGVIWWQWQPRHKQIGECVIFAMAVYIVITWVFDNTRGSLLMAMLMHASMDTLDVPPGLLFAPADVFNSLLLSFGLLALLLLALTRGRLGYQHYRQEEPDPVTAQPEEGIRRTPFI